MKDTVVCSNLFFGKAREHLLYKLFNWSLVFENQERNDKILRGFFLGKVKPKVTRFIQIDVPHQSIVTTAGNLNTTGTIEEMNVSKQKLKQYAPIAIAVIFATGVVGYMIYRQVSIVQDRERFAKAKVSLESLHQQIEQQVSKPDRILHEDNCRYSSLKFAKGPLSCRVEIDLLYESKESTIANELMIKVSSLLGKTPEDSNFSTIYNNKQTSFVPKKQERADQRFHHDYTDIDNDLSCSVSYVYPAKSSNFEEHLYDENNENFEILLSCGGSAKSEHFPVTN